MDCFSFVEGGGICTPIGKNWGEFVHLQWGEFVHLWGEFVHLKTRKPFVYAGFQPT